MKHKNPIRVTRLPSIAHLLLSLLPLASAHADVPTHPPVPEYECAAECWSVDTAASYAQFSYNIREWGPDAGAIVWAFHTNQCPAPSVVVHSRLVGEHTHAFNSGESSTAYSSVQGSAWAGNFSPYYYNYSAAYAGASSFSHTSSYAHSFESSLELQFDSATPFNSCRDISHRLPTREIGDAPVGG